MEDNKSSSMQQININVLLLNVLSEIKKNNDNSFVLAEFKTYLDAIFLDLNQSNYLFECINQLIFNNDKSFQSKNFNEEPIILYQIIFELNKTLSFPYINYYLQTLKEMLPLIENIIFVKNSFIEFIYIFFEDESLPEDKKQELLQRLINFCTETMENNLPKVKMHGSYLYGLLIEKYPLIFKDAQISTLWKIISNFYGDKKFSNKLYLLYCNTILIYKTKEKFKPFSNLCLFKILDYLTDKDWLKRKMAIQIINALLIYCRDDILTIKDNIVGFLSVVKEDSVPQVRDICLQTLNSIENENIQPKINMNLISGLKYGFEFEKNESQNNSVLEGIKEVNEKEYESVNNIKNLNDKNKNVINSNSSNQHLSTKKKNYNKTNNNKKYYDKMKNNGSNLKHRSASTRQLQMKFLENDKRGNSKKAFKSIHGSFYDDENSGRNKKNNYNNTFAYINTTNASQKRNKEESQSATTKKNKKFIRIDSTEELRKKLEKEKLFLEQIEKQINERKNNDEIKKLNNQKSFNEIMLPNSSKQNLNDYINKSNNRNNTSKNNITGNNKNDNNDMNNSFNKINNTTKNSNNTSKNKSNRAIKNLKKEDNITNPINNKKQFKPKSQPNEPSNNNVNNNNNPDIENNNLDNNINNNNLNNDNNLIEKILSQLENLNKSQEDIITQINYMNNKIDTNYKNLDERLKAVEKTVLITKKVSKNEINKVKGVNEEEKKFEEIKNNFLNGDYTSAIMDSIENDKYLFKLLPLITADLINNGIDTSTIEDLISRVSLKVPRFTSSDKTYVSNILSFFNQVANSGIDLKLITKLNLKDTLKYIKCNFGLRLTQKDNSYIDNVLKII